MTRLMTVLVLVGLAAAGCKKHPGVDSQKAAMVVPQIDELLWSFGGPLSGLKCVRIDEPKDSHGWYDNFLCSKQDLGLRWSSSGPIPGLVCTKIDEPADRDG